MKKEKEYIRLPGRKRKFVGWNRLWMGRDHLLSVDARGYWEDYKRFYYADIQAFIIRKTVNGKINNITFGLVAALFVSLAWLGSKEGRVLFTLLAGINIFFIVVNALWGPTCACHVQTAVQTERLPSLNRLRTALKVINILRPLIEHAQGEPAPGAPTAETRE